MQEASWLEVIYPVEVLKVDPVSTVQHLLRRKDPSQPSTLLLCVGRAAVSCKRATFFWPSGACLHAGLPDIPFMWLLQVCRLSGRQQLYTHM